MNELQRQITSYFNTPNEVSELLAQSFEKEELKKNDFHTHLGSRKIKLSFIKSGYLRLYRSSEKKEITHWVSSPGEMITDLSATLMNGVSSSNIQAITDCSLYSINHEEYMRLPEVIPNWHEIEKLLLAKCFIAIESRVFTFLSMTSEERYEHLLQNNPGLFASVPQQYIASMLGMTPETFSRIRKKSIS